MKIYLDTAQKSLPPGHPTLSSKFPVEIFQNYGIETEIITASVRHVMHIIQAARLGADIATVPYGVMKKSLTHPLTDVGVKNFLTDWAKVAPSL